VDNFVDNLPRALISNSLANRVIIVQLFAKYKKMKDET
jgi:hypothetical protein